MVIMNYALQEISNLLMSFLNNKINKIIVIIISCS